MAKLTSIEYQFLRIVLISWGCSHKVQQTALKTAEMYYLTVL